MNSPCQETASKELPSWIKSKATIGSSHAFWTLMFPTSIPADLLAYFFFFIKRNNLPQKYSEAANTTENKSTIISRSSYICLKQIKQNHWQDPKPKYNEFLTRKDSTIRSKDQSICGSWKEQLMIPGELCRAEEVRMGKTLFPFPISYLILKREANFGWERKTCQVSLRWKLLESSPGRRPEVLAFTVCLLSPPPADCKELYGGFVPCCFWCLWSGPFPCRSTEKGLTLSPRVRLYRRLVWMYFRGVKSGW